MQLGLGWESEPRYSREEGKVDAKRTHAYYLKRGHKICSKTVLKFLLEKVKAWLGLRLNDVFRIHKALRITEGYGVRGFFSVWFADLLPMAGR